MAQIYSQLGKGLSKSRKALLGVRVALERESDRPDKLEPALKELGVTFDKSLDVHDLLHDARANLNQEGRPRMHPLHLAHAAMAVLRQGAGGDDSATRLREVATLLAKDDEADKDHVGAVQSALVDAAAVTTPAKQRWKQVKQKAAPSLQEDLDRIQESWCHRELRVLDNEEVSKVETKLVVDSGTTTLDDIAPAVLPYNWPHCNDFFCSLIRTPERDPADATGGDLTVRSKHWRGVYEERVGGCPNGWFPDTFLIFDWYRTHNQIIMRYKLAPRRPGDRTVLKVDEGYIQVTRLVKTFEVSTVKYLLFDDERMPGGGQVLAGAACQLGWLDHVLNQFTDCAAELSGSHRQTAPADDAAGDAGQVGAPGSDIGAGLQRVLARCEDQLRESATDTEAQLRAAMAKMRAGDYGLDEVIDGCGQAMVSAVRDGARLLSSQRDFAVEFLEMVNSSTRL